MPWSERRSRVADAVLWEELDIVGFQEALTNQVEDLAKLLGTSFSWIGVGRDDGKKAGEYVPIFYRNTRFKPLSTTHFWLSETPSVPGSKNWDAGQTRMVTLIHFQDLYSSDSSHSGEQNRWAGLRRRSMDQGEDEDEEKRTRVSSAAGFYVLNTHWDDRGVQSRTEAAKIILQQVEDLISSRHEGKSKPLVILLGDLNSPAEEEGYGTLTGHAYPPFSTVTLSSYFLEKKPVIGIPFKDTRHSLTVARVPSATPLLHSPFGETGTFTSFSPTPVNSIIDFILFLDNGAVGTPEDGEKRDWEVNRVGVIPNQFWDGRGRMYTSDHRLVVAQFEPTDK
ncbi:hypothetical protein T439DRAFT_360324 [Meredithblackwellia eburnea MCA 4105]